MTQYIKLDEYKNCLSEIGEEIHLAIPLPKLLFPKKTIIREVASSKAEDAIEGCAKKRQREIPENVIDIMRDASPEIKLIYDFIKHGSGIKEISPDANSARKEDALSCFEEHQNKFTITHQEDLIDPETFTVVTGQEARSIKGHLFQKIVKRLTGEEYSYQKLFIVSVENK